MSANEEFSGLTPCMERYQPPYTKHSSRNVIELKKADLEEPKICTSTQTVSTSITCELRTEKIFLPGSSEQKIHAEQVLSDDLCFQTDFCFDSDPSTDHVQPKFPSNVSRHVQFRLGPEELSIAEGHIMKETFSKSLINTTSSLDQEPTDEAKIQISYDKARNHGVATRINVAVAPISSEAVEPDALNRVSVMTQDEPKQEQESTIKDVFASKEGKTIGHVHGQSVELITSDQYGDSVAKHDSFEFRGEAEKLETETADDIIETIVKNEVSEICEQSLLAQKSKTMGEYAEDHLSTEDLELKLNSDQNLEQELGKDKGKPLVSHFKQGTEIGMTVEHFPVREDNIGVETTGKSSVQTINQSQDRDNKYQITSETAQNPKTEASYGAIPPKTDLEQLAEAVLNDEMDSKNAKKDKAMVNEQNQAKDLNTKKTEVTIDSSLLLEKDLKPGPKDVNIDVSEINPGHLSGDDDFGDKEMVNLEFEDKNEKAISYKANESVKRDDQRYMDPKKKIVEKEDVKRFESRHEAAPERSNTSKSHETYNIATADQSSQERVMVEMTSSDFFEDKLGLDLAEAKTVGKTSTSYTEIEVKQESPAANKDRGDNTRIKQIKEDELQTASGSQLGADEELKPADFSSSATSNNPDRMKQSESRSEEALISERAEHITDSYTKQKEIEETSMVMEKIPVISTDIKTDFDKKGENDKEKLINQDNEESEVAKESVKATSVDGRPENKKQKKKKEKKKGKNGDIVTPEKEEVKGDHQSTTTNITSDKMKVEEQTKRKKGKGTIKNKEKGLQPDGINPHLDFFNQEPLKLQLRPNLLDKEKLLKQQQQQEKLLQQQQQKLLQRQKQRLKHIVSEKKDAPANSQEAMEGEKKQQSKTVKFIGTEDDKAEENGELSDSSDNHDSPIEIEEESHQPKVKVLKEEEEILSPSVSRLKQSRSEKKARKALSKMGLKQVSGVMQITMRRNKNVMFTIDKPDVFRNPGSETFVIFGEARIDDLDERSKSAAADKFLRTGPSEAVRNLPKAEEEVKGAQQPQSDEDEEDQREIDDSGIESKDIELVMSQTGVSRPKAIRALRDNQNDIVNAIMELTT